MSKKIKLTRLWEWISNANLSGSAPKTASLSYPDDAQQDGSTLIPVVSKQYKDETIIIDGRNFINCEFSGCTIQWNGNNFIFSSCVFNGAQKLVSTVPQVAGAMKLANVCGLLNEMTNKMKFYTRNKTG